MWMDLQRVLGVEVNFVPPYHQATNGAIERQHRPLKESIKAALIEMGDLHKNKWMEQLPLTLLGRRVSLHEDMQASPAQLTLGGENPLIPGVLVPDSPSAKDNDHELLKSLQVQSNTPVIPMSSHCDPKPTYVPQNFEDATHLFVKLESPQNLGEKFTGPHLIVDRPSNTTVTIKVGYTKGGLPRLQTHHWSNCRVAYLRPGTQDAH